MSQDVRTALVETLNELKAIRRVRTPAGVERYDKPIGAIITRGSINYEQVQDEEDYAEFRLTGTPLDTLPGQDEDFPTRVSFRVSNTQNEHDVHKISVVSKPEGEQYGSDAAWMSWDATTGRVDGLNVHPGFQRRGVASVLWQVAEAIAEENDLPLPQHSETQTDEGRAWARSFDERRQSKSARLEMDRFERKVRRVRTPAGAEHYDQPIGSIIVPDVPTPRKRTASKPRAATGARKKPQTLTKPAPGSEAASGVVGRSRSQRLDRQTTDRKGWKKYTHGSKVYYVGRDNGQWVAQDKTGKQLSTGPSEGEAFRALEKHLKFPDRVKPQSMAHMKPMKEKAELDAIKEKFGVAVPPGLGQIHLADLDTPERNVFGGIQADGSWRVFPSKMATEASAEQKWARISRLKPYIDKLDAALADAEDDDGVALSVLIMRLTAMRVSSSRIQRGAHQTFGATTLQARHVRFNKDSITFNFVGKDGVKHNLNSKDPELRRRVEKMMEGKSGQDELTPRVSAAATIEFIRNATGQPDFKNHDLRTYLANVIAVEVLEKYKGPRKKPKTKAEFAKMRREVGDVVSKQLGNNRLMALNSYVSPAVFMPFAQEGWM